MQGPNTLINENRIRRVFVNIQYQNNANHQGVIRALFLQYCFGFMSMIFINVLMPYQLHMQMILHVYSNIQIF